MHCLRFLLTGMLIVACLVGCAGDGGAGRNEGHGGGESTPHLPVAQNDIATTVRGTPVDITVLANDSDVDGDALTVTGVTQSTHGEVMLNTDGTVRYTPASNFNGSDSFTYTVSDGHGGTATATVNVTVTPVNDPPNMTTCATGAGGLTLLHETFGAFQRRLPTVLNPLIDWDTLPVNGTGAGGAPVAPGTSATQPNALTAALSGLGLTIENVQPGSDAVVDAVRFFDASLALVSSERFQNGLHIRLLFGDVDPATPGTQLPVAIWIHTAGNAASIYATEDGALETSVTTVSNDSLLTIESARGLRSIRIEGAPGLFRIVQGISFAGTHTLCPVIGTTEPTITSNGQQFIRDGHPFAAVGANSWFIAADPHQTVPIAEQERLADGPGTGLQSISFQRFATRVHNLVAKYRNLHFTVARLWAFNEMEWQRLPSFVTGVDGVYDQALDRRFDYVVTQFAEAGIRLILVFSNSHPDLGGNQQYVDWVRTLPGGDPTIGTDPDAFYQHALTRVAIKNHLRRQLTRVNAFRGVALKDDPVVFAFEAQNEPRYVGRLIGTRNLGPINDFLQDISTFIRTVDGGPDDMTPHLIGLGSEGFMNDGRGLFPLDNGAFDGVDLQSQHAFAAVDYITVHTFPHPNHNFGDGPGPNGDSLFWDGAGLPGEPQATTGFAGPFDPEAVTAVLAAASAIARTLGKPLVIEEYGIQPLTDPWGLTGHTRDTIYQRIHDMIRHDLSRNGPIAGALVWQLVHDDFPLTSGDGFELRDILGSQKSTADLLRHAARLLLP